MRYSFLILSTIGLFVLISACSKDSDNGPNSESESQCSDMALNPNWITEDFKTDYLIQFPDDYVGIGMVGFEGNIFYKYSPDSTIALYYSYCSPLWCDDFGDTIDIMQTEITLELNNGLTILLEETQEFCDQGELVGKLYYNDLNESFGMYCMKEETVWREAARMEFRSDRLDDLQEILATIHED